MELETASARQASEPTEVEDAKVHTNNIHTCTHYNYTPYAVYNIRVLLTLQISMSVTQIHMGAYKTVATLKAPMNAFVMRATISILERDCASVSISTHTHTLTLTPHMHIHTHTLIISFSFRM